MKKVAIWVYTNLSQLCEKLYYKIMFRFIRGVYLLVRSCVDWARLIGYDTIESILKE